LQSILDFESACGGRAAGSGARRYACGPAIVCRPANRPGEPASRRPKDIDRCNNPVKYFTPAAHTGGRRPGDHIAVHDLVTSTPPKLAPEILDS
jgi:hypothetical protein